MVTEARTIDGNRVKIRTTKCNIVPVIIIPWAGEKNIEIKNGEKLSLAQCVISQGGLVIFTSEFEKYLQKRTGKKVIFNKLFKTWLEEGKEKEFTTYLLEYLFGSAKFLENRIKVKEDAKEIKKISKLKVDEIKVGQFIKPMLLNEYFGESFDNPVAIEPKIDGIRIQLHIDKRDNLVLVFTRNGKEKKLENKKELMKEVDCENCILDGELVKNRISVFDILCLDNKILTEKPYFERRKILEKILKKENKSLILVPSIEVNHRLEIQEMFKTFVCAGYEGIVIKDISSIYNPGTRSSRWLKWKEVKTIDLFVHKVYKDESKKHRKWIHELACWKDGELFIVFKYPSVEKIEEGTVVEVEFNQITKNGKIRHIKNLKVREDKTKYECNFN
jgi:ATP-dependent DNA ligase